MNRDIEEVDQPDPATALILALLAKDMAVHPEHVQSMDAGFVDRLRRLTEGVDVDLNATLSPDDE